MTDDVTKPDLTKTIANIITTHLIGLTQKLNRNIEELISKENLIQLANLFSTKQINNQGLQIALEHSAKDINKDINETVRKLGLIQVNDDASVLEYVKQVIKKNPTQVEEFKNGKEAVMGYLVGQGMKISQGKSNPQKLRELLIHELA